VRERYIFAHCGGLGELSFLERKNQKIDPELHLKNPALPFLDLKEGNTSPLE
jgi:hypothetical protein